MIMGKRNRVTIYQDCRHGAELNFSAGGLGGLISIVHNPDTGTVDVELYRLDSCVRVTVPLENLNTPHDATTPILTGEHVAALRHYTRPPEGRDAKAVSASITHDLQGAGWITWHNFGEGCAWTLTDSGMAALTSAEQ